ncbi:hypothetical protein [Hymenobacter bucti]|uniref:DUF2490 domain-containing protein n=1 Tax=Hymenobacter bucti TaxID=1844114 RepID=A0ABW4R1S1_9BACT
MMLLALSTCTPPKQTHVDLRTWVVVNHTADTLTVRVHYLLDSVQLSASDARQARQRWHTDSLAYGGRGLLRHPFWRLSTHQGHWYQVDEHQGEVNPFLDNTPTVRVGRLDSLSTWRQFEAGTLPTYLPIGRAASLDRVHGVVTYRVAPHRKQVLTTEYALSSSSQALVESALSRSQALVGLSVTQGNAHRTLLPGKALTDLFRSIEYLPAKDYNWYQRQLTIGATLQIED